MAADVTLTSANAAVQAAPTAKTRLGAVAATPRTRTLIDTYTCADALEVGDKIRVRKAYGGQVIIPVMSDVVEATTASALTLDIGVYEVADDGTIGTVIDADILADGVDFAGAGVYSARPYTVPTSYAEVWIVAEVMAVAGSTAAAETIDFYTAVNSEN